LDMKKIALAIATFTALGGSAMRLALQNTQSGHFKHWGR